jgi:hypothetical protein
LPIEIAAHLCWRRIAKDETYDLCAVFHLARPTIPILVGGSGREIQTMARLGKCCDGHMEQTVLINVIEFPENPEQRREFSVGAIVRLYPLNRCPHRRAETLNPPLHLVKLRGVTGEGESELGGVGRGILPGFVDGDSVDQVVEGASQVVDAISDPEINIGEIPGVNDMENPTVFGSIGIELL